jgi:N4-(beta-N-acetylglucosaminyl)-L-asparaginase
MNIGAVAALRNIKDAIAVARHVLENTKHTMLAGELATEFAVQMGFKRESLATETSQKMWTDWKNNRCQPNFWENVVPAPTMGCGPYEPVSANNVDRFWYQQKPSFGLGNHDTIGMVVLDTYNNIAAGTSTNGARNKIPGRVGDSPIPGAGAYADNLVGAASATGDGDIMMRFLPSLLAVEDMRRGVDPHTAGENALRRIAQYYPSFMGAIVVVKIDGTYGAACHGIDRFPFSVYHPNTDKVLVEFVDCFV